MTSGAEWEGQVGQTWAESYVMTDRALSGVTQHLLERLVRTEGQTIVDIGCGAGELSMALARARPAALVTGVDISADLVAAARERASNLPNARFIVADAAVWQNGEAKADLLVSRHGVMFFDDPVAAFSNLRAQTAPEARMVFSCFREPKLNEWATGVGSIFEIAPAEDPHAPGPFAFAEDDRLRSILARSGWRDVDLAPVDFAFVAGMGVDAVDEAVAFFTRIGPAARVLREMPKEERPAKLDRLRQWIARKADSRVAAFPAAAWLVTARNPG